jgi:hypothetical protein
VIYTIQNNYYFDDNVAAVYDPTLYPSEFVIKTSATAQADADAELIALQSQAVQQNLSRFTCVLVTTNAAGHETWEACDFSKEPTTSTAVYSFFDMQTGQHIQATGYANAQAVLQQVQANFLAAQGLDKVQTVTSIPTLIDLGM